MVSTISREADERRIPGRFILPDLACIKVGEGDLLFDGESVRLVEGESVRRSAEVCEDVFFRECLGGGSFSEVTATLVELSRKAWSES